MTSYESCPYYKRKWYEDIGSCTWAEMTCQEDLTGEKCDLLEEIEEGELNG